MKQENHNLSVKRRIYSFPQEGESRAEAICRSFKLYTLVEWAAYTKVDIRIESKRLRIYTLHNSKKSSNSW